MSNEYLPLAKLIEQGLQEGTVLEIDSGAKLNWSGTDLYWVDGSHSPVYPFQNMYRIVSTPPKKITFEAVVSGALGYKHTRVPDYAEFKAGDAVIVTVEEKR